MASRERPTPSSKKIREGDMMGEDGGGRREEGGGRREIRGGKTGIGEEIARDRRL